MYGDIFPQFKRVVTWDSEFQTEPAGRRPAPVSVAWRDLRSRREGCLFRGEFGPEPPFPIDEETLMVCYYASAEHGTSLALGWPRAPHTLDLFIEFSNLTNGLPLPHGRGLVGAMTYFGLMYPGDKGRMIPIINRGNWVSEDVAEIKRYNLIDVDAAERVMLAMYPLLDQPRAIYRGLFTPTAAEMEWRGVPVDMHDLTRLRRHWTDIQERLIARINRDYGIYDGRTFKEDAFENWLAIEGIPWPRLDSGRLALDDKVFREIGKIYPDCVGPIRELRHALSQLRLEDLAVGDDGRNRTLTSYFRARTSRSQPSNSKSIFGTSVWLRELIAAPRGVGLIAADYSQQEFGTGAGLSGDPVMGRAYNIGDAYLGFAAEAKATTTEDVERYLGRRERRLAYDDDDNLIHSVRELFKPVVLSIQYGRGEYGLARTLDVQPIEARALIAKSHETFKVFWDWSDARVRYALQNRHTSTALGWTLHLAPDTAVDNRGPMKNKTVIETVNIRSLQNFPLQANAAEMTRLAATLASERGISILLTVHDAIIAEAPLGDLEAAAATLEACMVEASRIILGGFALRVDSKLIGAGGRYHDKRGEAMWRHVTALLDEIEEEGGRAVA
jgi:DNA polymerase-1